MFEEMLWRGRWVEMSEGGYVLPNRTMVDSRKRGRKYHCQFLLIQGLTPFFSLNNVYQANNT